MKQPPMNHDADKTPELPEDRLEGRHPVTEALKAGRTVDKIWVARREGRPDPVLGRIIRDARDSGTIVSEVERTVLDQMSLTRNHQGLIAQVAAHDYLDLDELLKRCEKNERPPFLILLDELKDSYNLGSILRIADAAGCDGIVIPQRRSVGLNAAVSRASAGAIEHVPVVKVTNMTQTVLKLKEKGFWIFGTDAEAGQTYDQADWSGSLAIITGSEGEGLSAALRKHCDFLVSIPMRGHVNSLNAAVATGIIVFEAVRQRWVASGQR